MRSKTVENSNIVVTYFCRRSCVTCVSEYILEQLEKRGTHNLSSLSNRESDDRPAEVFAVRIRLAEPGKSKLDS